MYSMDVSLDSLGAALSVPSGELEEGKEYQMVLTTYLSGAEGGSIEFTVETGNEPTLGLPEPDRAVHDTAVHDTGVLDTMVHDTAVHDTMVHDTAVHDTAVHDTMVHDTMVHDTAVHDTALRDTAVLATVIPNFLVQGGMSKTKIPLVFFEMES